MDVFPKFIIETDDQERFAAIFSCGNLYYDIDMGLEEFWTGFLLKFSIEC